MTLAGNYIKGDAVLDPEKAMARDIAKKKMHLTRTSETCRKEFIAAYTSDFGITPDFTNPFIHTYFNAWIVHQGKTEWLTDEEKVEKAAREAVNNRRAKTISDTRQRIEAEKKALAKQRKAAADAQYKAIRAKGKKK